MNALLLTAVLSLAAASARAEGAGVVSHDALTVQIRRKAVEPGAGIVTVVRLGSGQTFSLKVVELDALSGLKPLAGLIETRASAPAPARKRLKASVELKLIKKAGWAPASGHRAPL